MAWYWYHSPIVTLSVSVSVTVAQCASLPGVPLKLPYVRVLCLSVLLLSHASQTPLV